MPTNSPEKEKKLCFKILLSQTYSIFFGLTLEEQSCGGGFQNERRHIQEQFHQESSYTVHSHLNILSCVSD
jgi:hypothetical protein